MIKAKSFLLSFLIAVFSVLFIAGCGTESESENTGNGSGITPIDLTGNPFSLLGVYEVEAYGINGEPVEIPSQASELRVGLNLSTAASASKPEVIMVLNFNGQIIPFGIHEIDLSTMQGDLNSFIASTFKGLGAELSGTEYDLTFTLSPNPNTQYQPLVDNNIIKSGEYLKLKLTKKKDIQVDTGLSTNDEIDPSLEVTSFGLSKSVHNITKKGTFKVDAFFAPIGASSVLTWKSDNDQVATVDNNGNVTIKSNGNATITATTASGLEATMEVRQAVLGEITLDKQALTLYVNKDGSNPQTHQLKLSGVADILGATITYGANNGNSVVSVNENGLITAVSAGTATVTATAVAGGVTKTATCTVTVSAYPEGIVFEKAEYGVALGGTTQIKPYLLGTTTYATPVTYATNMEGIINIDNNGNITTIKTGDVEVTATYTFLGQNHTATTKISVYTPANLNNLQSMQGTYEIVDFSQKSSMLSSGTTDGVNNVQRMIGEVTIEIVGGQAVVKSKIQMNCDAIYNYGSVAHEGLFSVTSFENMNYASNELKSPSYTDSVSIFNQGNKNAGKLTSFANNKFVIKQVFMELVVGVTVNTYIVKKSDTVKQLTDNRYFDYMDFGKTVDSHAKQAGKGNAALNGIDAYYSYGVRSY